MSKGTVAQRSRPRVEGRGLRAGGTRNAQTIRQSIQRGDTPRSVGRAFDRDLRRNAIANGATRAEAADIVRRQGVMAAIGDREGIVAEQTRAARSAARAAARARNATGRGNSRGRRARR